MKLNKLKGKIVERGMTQTAVACELGLAQSTLSQKINQERQFHLNEIARLIEVLQLSDDEIIDIFFNY